MPGQAATERMISMIHMLPRVALISCLTLASVLPLASAAVAEGQATRHATFRVSTQGLPNSSDGRCKVRSEYPHLTVLVKRHGKTIRKVPVKNIPERAGFCYKRFTFKAPKSSKLKFYWQTSGKGWRNTQRLLRCSSPSEYAKLVCISVR
jgi:hypothetical protein